jgi:hypothetical protein
MAEILIAKPGALNQRDRALLRKNGVVCIEAENPSDVKLIAASGAEVSAGSMLFAALKALHGDGYRSDARTAFVKALTEAMELAREECSSQ